MQEKHFKIQNFEQSKLKPTMPLNNPSNKIQFFQSVTTKTNQCTNFAKIWPLSKIKEEEEEELSREMLPDSVVDQRRLIATDNQGHRPRTQIQSGNENKF